MADDRSVFIDQLEARSEWEKYRISNNPEHGEMALHYAEAAGFGANEKTQLLRNVPELSKAFDEGRSNAETDWAISRLDDNPHLKYGPDDYIKPEVGKTYQGRIIDGDSDTVYQAVKMDGRDIVVMHKLNELSSIQSDTFSASPQEVNIRYIAHGVAVGKLVQKELGDRSLEHKPKGMDGQSR